MPAAGKEERPWPIENYEKIGAGLGSQGIGKWHMNRLKKTKGVNSSAANIKNLTSRRLCFFSPSSQTGGE